MAIDTNLQQKVRDTAGGLSANQDFVNAAFKAYHNRDANAGELTKFTGQTVDQVRNAVMGGAKTAKLPTLPQPEARPTNIDTGAGHEAVIETPTVMTNMADELSKIYGKTSSDIDQAILKLQSDREKIAQEEIKRADQRRSDAALGYENTREMDMEAERKRLEEEAGLKEKEAALVEVQGLVADLNEQYGLTDAAIRGKNINSAIIRGQRQIAYEEYAAKATGLGARADIIEGQYDRASQKVENYFNIVTAKRAEDLDYYGKLIDMADNDIIRFSAEERSAVDNTVSLLLDRQARDEAEKQNKIALMLDPALAMAFQQSGATMDMGYEEIIQAMQPKLAEILTKEWNDKYGVATGGTGTGGVGGTGYTDANFNILKANKFIIQDANGYWSTNEDVLGVTEFKNFDEYNKYLIMADNVVRQLNAEKTIDVVKNPVKLSPKVTDENMSKYDNAGYNKAGEEVGDFINTRPEVVATKGLWDFANDLYSTGKAKEFISGVAKRVSK